VEGVRQGWVLLRRLWWVLARLRLDARAPTWPGRRVEARPGAGIQALRVLGRGELERVLRVWARLSAPKHGRDGLEEGHSPVSGCGRVDAPGQPVLR
jgi:hypothetical protein